MTKPMCGISLAVNSRGLEVPLSLIHLMNDKVSHRGPDGQGIFRHQNLALGHRRLSIIDRTDSGHQPMQRGDLWISYNGEIYNYIELRKELEKLGHVFRGQSDTEVILAAYQEWGELAFKRFNGMWAFVIFDSARKRVIGCRDHFGIKPLLYTWAGDYFLACSEIKQMMAVPGFRPELAHDAAYNFLMNGSLNYSESSFFKNIFSLEPGHHFIYNIEANAVLVKRWYDLSKEIKPVTDDFETAREKVRSLLTESIRLRMRSDVNVGSCLSGGIDSSSIVSLIHARHYSNSRFATVTSCYEDKNYDESYYSDQVAHQTGYKSIKVFPHLEDLLDSNDLDKMIYHHEQPFSSASHYSEFKVFEGAAQHGLKVMQDGQGSDECFFGYEEFHTALVQELVSSGRIPAALNTMREKASVLESPFMSELQKFGRTKFYQPTVQIAKRMLGIPKADWLNARWQVKMNESKYRGKSVDCKSLSYEQMRYTSMPYQLHSLDRNSMMFGVESRLPFLDPRLVEYAMGMPNDYKLRNGFSKAILREAVPEMPAEVRYRKRKMGFVAPDSVWMKQNQAQVRKELQKAISHTGMFTQSLLTRFDQFTAGKLGFEPLYMRAISFSKLTEIFDIAVRA